MKLWNSDNTEIIGKLADRIKDLERKMEEQAKQIEEMRMAKSISKNRPVDIELDSNWHIRRRQLERQMSREDEIAK